eukprot:CAMPEP_0172453312 /NCGR_PEP_ID=MMETSP1065-20121228/10693_1 /TAXON_ID=265537 /ORGANISM="Amphiprora paludosa, Strain CCMP125" /LENGTH=416 /DNA_ID=CAMNT_0013205491 /DNA_START=121 /DNA_END=1371 /DNA_ORIENTATION=+
MIMPTMDVKHIEPMSPASQQKRSLGSWMKNKRDVLRATKSNGSLEHFLNSSHQQGSGVRRAKSSDNLEPFRSTTNRSSKHGSKADLHRRRRHDAATSDSQSVCSAANATWNTSASSVDDDSFDTVSVASMPCRSSYPAKSLTSSSKTSKSKQVHHVSPQSYLASMVKTRGYSAAEFASLDTAYYNKPTKYQRACYASHLCQAIRENDVPLVKEMIECGVSPNACNSKGESIVHLACRLGRAEILQILVSLGGANLQVTDNYGRTCLHSVCCSPEPCCFNVVDLILKQDRRLLFISDNRGCLPLSYLRESKWNEWTKYFMSRKETFWPERNMVMNGAEAAPPLTRLKPNTKPIPNPRDPLPLELARLVVKGQVAPMECAILKFSTFSVSCRDLGSSSDEESLSGHEIFSESGDESED